MKLGMERFRLLDIPAQLEVERISLRMHLPSSTPLPLMTTLCSGFSVVPFGDGGTSSGSWARICNEAGELSHEDDPEAALLQRFHTEFGAWVDTELPRRMFFVLDAAGAPVATATAWFEMPVVASPNASRGRVHWISVSPRVQGLGLAKSLLILVLRKLRGLHCGTDGIYLTTQTTSARAIAMYIELGFMPEPGDSGLGLYTSIEQKGWQMLADKLHCNLGFVFTPKHVAPKKLLVYLASPCGFSSSMKTYVLPRLIEAIETVGVEVYEPFERNAQAGLIKQEDAAWAWDVAQADARAVQNCDAVFAVVNGVPPDEGVCVEVGIAIACNKPIFLFRDDFRKAADSESFPCNLMLMAGLPRDESERSRFIYTDVAQIADPGKALYEWAQLNGTAR